MKSRLSILIIALLFLSGKEDPAHSWIPNAGNETDTVTQQPAPQQRLDTDILERRTIPVAGGWRVDSLRRTEDPLAGTIVERQTYSGAVREANLVYREAWVADRIVLSATTQGGLIEPEVESWLQNAGLTLLRSYPFSPVRIYGLPEGDLDAAELWKTGLEESLAGSGISIAKDHLLYPAATIPNDLYFSEQWALEQIRAPEAWDLTTGNPEVVVAVLDTGLQMDHEDFYSAEGSNLWVNPDDPPDGLDNDGNGLVDDVYGWDFVNESGVLIEDTYGHGTLVSGILGAVGNNGTGISGVAWRTRILPLRAGAASLPNSILAQSMDYVTDLRLRGYPVVATSNSYGYYPGENPSPEEWSKNSVIGQAIERARQAGILVITASGNGGQNNDSPYTRHFYPSDAFQHNVITANALESSGVLWRGSNYGAESVDVAAPGLQILTTYRDGAYRSWSGTSMAAPHVSGAAALLASLRPELNLSWQRALILGSVGKDPSLEGKITSGGTLDLARMLELASLPLEEAWKRLYWTDAELSQMTFSWDENPDGDDWTHLMELAFGGNPRVADSQPEIILGETAIPRGKSGRDTILTTLRHLWSPLADGLVARSFEATMKEDGPWVPAIPRRYEVAGDDPASGIRFYEGEFKLPRKALFIRMQLELGAQKPIPGLGPLSFPVDDVDISLGERNRDVRLLE